MTFFYLLLYFSYNKVMNKKEYLIIIYTITVLLSVMYATQPLQPLLASEFNISITKASSFTAIIMLFLAIAPIIYGYILQSANVKKVLLIASCILFFTNICLGFSNSYEMFLFLRILEALVIPAIITACMTVLASNKENIKRNMSIYVASTVFGGLIGRVLSGFISSSFSWRYVFFSLSFAMLLGLFFIYKLSYEGEAKLTKAKFTDVINILKDKRFVIIYTLMFVTFFVFAGILNILPFIIKKNFPQADESMIGLLYLGYGVGIVVALYIHKIKDFFKKELRTIIFGILVFTLSTLLFLSQKLIVMFILVFFLCLGMFIVHTICTGLANSMRVSQKALTSGMYLTFYYLGGACGSFFPSLIYENFSWDITIYMFVFLELAVLIFVYINKSKFKAYS